MASTKVTPRETLRDVILVVSAAIIQEMLWVAFRWLGLQVHGEVPGASIPDWYAVVWPPLSRAISFAPPFAVGWLAARHGVLLGASAAVLASLLNWGFQHDIGVLPSWSLSLMLGWFRSGSPSILGSALAAAILGVVCAAAGAYSRARTRRNRSRKAESA